MLQQALGSNSPTQQMCDESSALVLKTPLRTYKICYLIIWSIGDIFFYKQGIN